jgi:hypothetical protein
MKDLARTSDAAVVLEVLHHACPCKRIGERCRRQVERKRPRSGIPQREPLAARSLTVIERLL